MTDSSHILFFFNGTPLELSPSGMTVHELLDEMKRNADEMIDDGLRVEQCTFDELANIYHAQLVHLENELCSRSQPSGDIFKTSLSLRTSPVWAN